MCRDSHARIDGSLPRVRQRKRLGFDIDDYVQAYPPGVDPVPLTQSIPDGYTRSEPALSTILIVAGLVWWATRR
jgi:hypothetical protein